MPGITIEDIVSPDIKKQKPPETIPKDEVFEYIIERDVMNQTAEKYPGKKVKKGIIKKFLLRMDILDFATYILIILLIITVFFLIKDTLNF